VIGSLAGRPSWMPLAVPKDLALRLARLHGNPIVWWMGQLIAYVMRPMDNLAALLEETAQVLGFDSPVVGYTKIASQGSRSLLYLGCFRLHIRRTDKIGTEASFHSLEEYMDHVEEYFNQLHLTTPVYERRVYIASDDPTVLNDAKIK
jgi:glycoprotein 6-alpha-L-fucosyltransferase